MNDDDNPQPMDQIKFVEVLVTLSTITVAPSVAFKDCAGRVTISICPSATLFPADAVHGRISFPFQLEAPAAWPKESLKPYVHALLRDLNKSQLVPPEHESRDVIKLAFIIEFDRQIIERDEYGTPTSQTWWGVVSIDCGEAAVERNIMLIQAQAQGVDELLRHRTPTKKTNDIVSSVLTRAASKNPFNDWKG